MVHRQAKEKRGKKPSQKAASRRSCCIPALGIIIIKNTQVIPQTGLSLCFELQRMHTQLKATGQGMQIKNRLQKNICLIILMHITCGSSVGVNYW